MGIINKKQRKLTIDIDGPEGNAFTLLAYANKFAKQMNLNTKEIQEEMMNGDYKNLVKTFDRYFGSIVDLKTSKPQLYK